MYRRSKAHPTSTYIGSGGFIAPQRSRIAKCIGGESGPSQYKIIRDGCIRPTFGSVETPGEVVDVRPSRIMPRAHNISGQLPIWYGPTERSPR